MQKLTHVSKTLAKNHHSPSAKLGIRRVLMDIFSINYGAPCMENCHCHDRCCSWGATITKPNVERLLEHREALEKSSGLPPEQWVVKHDLGNGHKQLRLNAQGGACIFLDRKGRGCMIHRYCLENGIDYHTLKPLVCAFFPLTVLDGRLGISEEITSEENFCRLSNQSVYRAQRDELLYYFGEPFVAELDAMEAAWISGRK